MGQVTGQTTVLVTGATGYLGRQVVSACLAVGCRIVVIVRDAEKCPVEWDIDQRVRIVETDINDLEALPEGVNVVAHLAASMAGDEAAQQRDTIGPTANLLDLCQATKPAIVLASSLSVYAGQQSNGILSETSAIEPQPARRDAYCRAKLAQEKMCQAYADQTDAPLYRLRIGAIWGAERLWNAHMGVTVGPALFMAGKLGQVPLSHVSHAAQAVQLAVSKVVEGASGTVNVVDSDLPDRGRFAQAIQVSGWPRFVFRLPVRGLLLIARLTGSRLPFGLLRAPVIRARLGDAMYDNGRLVLQLGWRSDTSFNVLMSEALEAENG